MQAGALPCLHLCERNGSGAPWPAASVRLSCYDAVGLLVGRAAWAMACGTRWSPQQARRLTHSLASSVNLKMLTSQQGL